MSTALATLFIVATPIGNLEDATFRAIRILAESDVILCEDTRVTKKLLVRYNIDRPLLSYSAHATISRVEKIFALLDAGKNLALVSDAGTPTISDPGSLLVSQVRERFGDAVAIVPIPGPSAALAALSVSGFPSSEFLFLGFLPHKKGRETLFREIAAAKRTVVFYESPHRVMKTFVSLAAHLGPKRHVMVGRELTKLHEELFSGTAKEVLAHYEGHPDRLRGEFVLVVASA